MASAPTSPTRASASSLARRPSLSWEWGLSLVGYGRGAEVHGVGRATLSAAGDRIDYHRGSLTEWYVNGPDGLKQGFTLGVPPEEMGDEEVRLDLALGGTLSPRISTGGQVIDFLAPGGEAVVRYAELAVLDATGDEIPARMEGFNEGGRRGIRIVFDDAGAVYPVTVDPLATSAAWTAEGGQVWATFGSSVGSAGDVNGDGYGDVIVGAPGHDNGQADEDRAFIYYGSAAGLSTVENWTAESDQAFTQFGLSVGTAGDVNGDGYGDVIVGAPVNDARVYVYLGNDGGGLSLRPQQRQADDGVPIAPLGISGSSDGFRLTLLGRTPFGRGKVKLEWEVKPLGTPFYGGGTSVSGAWIDTGAAGVAINELASGLASGTPHHWRVRLLYHPASIPLQQASRWLTVPWNGWQETDLRTATSTAAPAGRVPDGDTLPGVPLTLDKATGGDITLSWGDSCTATDDDYAIYEGSLGSFTSHVPSACSTGGATTETFAPAAGDRYYLVVPRNADREGAYGLDSEGLDRPAGETTCAPQELAGC